MDVVAPFQGVRYNLEKIAHLEGVVTSPYDVLSAEAGENMPHKSTHFSPKILTGLVINKLVRAEKIVLPE